MTHNRYNFMSAIILIGNFGTVIGAANTSYAAPELGRTRADIQRRFINVSPDIVAQGVKKGTPISAEFRNYLKNDRTVQKINEISHTNNDLLGLSIVSYQDDVAADIARREKELAAQHDPYYWIKRIAPPTIIASGVIIMLCATQADRNGTKAAVGFTGAVATTGGICLYSFGENGNNESITTNISELHIMGQDWQKLYTIPIQQQHQNK